MGDPIRTTSKAKPIRCMRDEELVEREDGAKICLYKFGAGEPGSISPPTPLPPEDQFTQAPPRDLKKLITGKAEYSCKTKLRNTEDWTITRDISVPAGPPNEKAEATKARLEKAARDVVKTIHGCHDVKFERLQLTPEEQAKGALKTPKVPPPKSEFDSMSEWNRICGPGGKWENHLLCWK